jgi:hypothetical protein
MNMRDYAILHFGKNYGLKKQRFYWWATFRSHNVVFIKNIYISLNAGGAFLV